MTVESVSLAGLLRRATPYECWRAPIHPRLRLVAIASGPSILICLGPLCGLLSLLALIDLAGLVVYIPMLVATGALREGRPYWHWAAFGEAILGAIHGFFVALGLAMVVLAAIIWLVMVCLLVMAVIVGLLGVAAGSSN